MRKLWIVGMFVILFVLMGCDVSPSGMAAGESFSGGNLQYVFQNPLAQDDQGKGKFLIDSIENASEKSSSSRALSSRSPEETYELWLMPTQRGGNEPIAHDNVSQVKYFSVDEEGGFEIPIADFPLDKTSIIFIVRKTNETNLEVVGFLTLKIDDNGYVLEFPPATEMNGDVEFGTVSVSEDSYVATSELSLTDNEGSFSTSILGSLQQQALTSNLALMAINILANTYTNVFYAPSLLLSYDLDDPDSWGVVELRVFSNDYTSKAALFTPQDANLNRSGGFKLGYGPRSSVQWSARLPLQDFLDKSAKGQLWKLKDENGAILATFDFSIALVLEKNDTPIIPCIEPTYTVQAGNSDLVETISFNWFSMGLDGITKNPITDEDELARMVSKNMFYMDLHTNDSSRGTYMFRQSNGGRGFGMEGNLLTATDFDAPLKVADLDKLSIGYRYTFYGCDTPWRPKE